MSISFNGDSTVPPGFRFHPTEEELLTYYLTKKVASENIDFDVIRDIDLNKLEPWDIQEKCRIGSTPQNDWYFFSHKDKKYPTGTRTNRATAAGFWKATGRDKVIYTNFRRIGMRKTLVFYKGRAPHGQKSDWIMHEYRLDELSDSELQYSNLTQEEGWVICRVFKKKSHHKLSVDQTTCSPLTPEYFKPPKSDGQNHAAGQHLKHLRPFDPLLIHERLTKLPSLDSPTTPAMPGGEVRPVQGTVYNSRETGFGDWAALDRFVASHLNGGDDVDGYGFCPSVDGEDLWSLATSATLSGLGHVSHVSHELGNF